MYIYFIMVLVVIFSYDFYKNKEIPLHVKKFIL